MMSGQEWASVTPTLKDGEMAKLMCWQCQRDLSDEPRPISRRAVCQGCFAPIRCCYMCRSFDVSHRSTCQEDRADPPLEKTNANFCDFFRPGQPVRRVAQSRDQSDASAALSALFDEAPAVTDLEGDRTDDGSDDLDQKLKDLFGDD